MVAFLFHRKFMDFPYIPFRLFFSNAGENACGGVMKVIRALQAKSVELGTKRFQIIRLHGEAVVSVSGLGSLPNVL
jgi:hypothetical protein